ncbi:hypothetical protein BJV78DRAFT_1360550, partial [Lactifluus subvellereus]
MPKTDDFVWSFNLRSYNPRHFSDSDSDSDDLVDNLCSDGSTLVDQPLSEDNDTAVFKPNPWSIAKINAASRLAQKSQQSNDASTLGSSIKKCDKKQPQGRIVDLLKKQAQQPASDTASGLRPHDTSLSSDARKHEDCPRKLDLTHAGSIVSASGQRRVKPGSLPKMVVGTHQPPNATRETRASYSKCSNLKESATQSSGTSRSGLLSPSARSPPTLVSVNNSFGLSSDVVTSGPFSKVYHNAGILSQKQAHSTSPSTHKKQHVSSSLVKQASMPVHDRSAPALMIADKTTDVDAMPAHYIVEKQKGTSTNAIQVSNAQSTAFVPASRSSSGLPLQTHQPRSSLPSSQTLPRTSQSGLEPGEPPRSISICSQTLAPNLPTPEQIDASCPAPSHARVSAYDHPALQPATEDDTEWSTLPQRQRQPRERLNNSITTSAKFRLPVCTRTSSPTTELDEVGTRKRPRITLYRPPPRTATVDIASLESRYALVRGAMRKRRCASTAAWDVLGLPSCGAVYVDGSAA